MDQYYQSDLFTLCPLMEHKAHVYRFTKKEKRDEAGRKRRMGNDGKTNGSNPDNDGHDTSYFR